MCVCVCLPMWCVSTYTCTYECVLCVFVRQCVCMCAQFLFVFLAVKADRIGHLGVAA
jgi:hypothetical protein